MFKRSYLWLASGRCAVPHRSLKNASEWAIGTPKAVQTILEGGRHAESGANGRYVALWVT